MSLYFSAHRNKSPFNNVFFLGIITSKGRNKYNYNENKRTKRKSLFFLFLWSKMWTVQSADWNICSTEKEILLQFIARFFFYFLILVFWWVIVGFKIFMYTKGRVFLSCRPFHSRNLTPGNLLVVMWNKYAGSTEYAFSNLDLQLFGSVSQSKRLPHGSRELLKLQF